MINTNGRWVNQTIEEFCIEKILENQPEEQCDMCGDKTQFWVKEFGGLLCIECAHSVYSDYADQVREWEAEQLANAYGGGL